MTYQESNLFDKILDHVQISLAKIFLNLILWDQKDI
jgi:hypothetical protein